MVITAPISSGSDQPRGRDVEFAPEHIRDRIQNHALQDVSSKSYAMPEKRAAMAQWKDFVVELLSKNPLTTL